MDTLDQLCVVVDKGLAGDIVMVVGIVCAQVDDDDISRTLLGKVPRLWVV